MRKKLFTFLLALVTSVGLLNAAVDGKLPGAFTVDGSGTQVCFSQGNLQATTNNLGAAWTWGFAENQWDYVGNSAANNAINGNGTVSTNGTVDLFGWSTSANYYGINNESGGLSSYLGDFVDWGTLMGTGWRTLEAGEWAYLLNTREASTVDGTSNARYAKATVNSVPGLILFPDGGSFNASEFTAVGSINNASAAFTTTTCSSTQWEALEDKGCVFLPTAGIRNVADVFFGGESGYYYTSTPYETALAYLMSFTSDFLEPQGCYGRYNGCAVRLVSETTPSGGSASSVTAARFLYNYDCQRSPSYPQVNSACNLWGFKDPYEGYKGYRNGNIALGPWKLEFVAYYTPSNNYGCASQVNSAVNQYYMGMSSAEKEAKKLEVPIFRLWQYNLTAQEFQPAAYGVVCAYASEGNTQDHGALFVSSNGMGCFLSGHQHTTSFDLTCENDLTTGLAALVDAASAPSDPYYDVVWPVIVSIDAIGTVELSEHCKYYIEGSRAAYNALTDEQKAQVTNYSTLTAAETQWAALVAAAQPYADEVIGLINAIPNPVVYTQDCKDKIDAAQAAYKALTDGQKVLVTNAETLPQATLAFFNAAHPNILFTADNSNIKRIEDVTLPKTFTAGYSTDSELLVILKELYGINEDAFIGFITSYNAAVTTSGNVLTVNPFSGTATIAGYLTMMTPPYDNTPYSVNITLELPPFGPAPTQDEQVPTNADPENPSYHYSTFFHSTQNYKLSNDGTQAFIADLSNNELVLTEIAHGEQVIPANTAVILRKTGSADPVVLVPTAENGASINPDDNDLRGVDEATTLVSLSINPLQCYVLSGKSHDETETGVGFYRIYGNTLKAHKAYVIFAGGSNNAPKKMRFVYGQATGIEDVQGNNVQSTKVIENGVLYIIRDGKTYNAMGQMVK